MIVKTIHHLMGSPHKITPAKYCDCGRMKIGLDEIEIVQFKTINNGQYCLQIFLCNYYFLHVVAPITIRLQSSQFYWQLVVDNLFSSLFKVFHQYFSSWHTGPLYFCSLTGAPTYISDV